MLNKPFFDPAKAGGGSDPTRKNGGLGRVGSDPDPTRVRIFLTRVK